MVLVIITALGITSALATIYLFQKRKLNHVKDGINDGIPLEVALASTRYAKNMYEDGKRVNEQV
ncbi:MAG: hypothetical protein ACTSVF_01375 [Candidatus Asgardarchaeia archaeon]